MGYILDIAVILIFVYLVLRGRKIGFVRSVIGLAGIVAAVVLAFTLSGPLANGIYSAFVQKPVIAAVEISVNEAIANTGSAAIGDNLQVAQQALPSFVQNLMDKNGISLSEVALTFVNNGTSTVGAQVATAVEQQVVKPVATVVMRYAVGIILLLVLLIAAGLLTRVISRIVRITPLKGLDGLLGGVLGAVKGVVWVLLLTTVVQLIAGFATVDAFISQQTIEQSILFGFIADHNPVFTAGDMLIGALTK